MIIAGNWKMNKTQSEVIELTTALSLALQKHKLADNHEVIICPSLVYLSKVKDILALLADKKIKVGRETAADEAARDIYLYASSQTPVSAVHVKASS